MITLTLQSGLKLDSGIYTIAGICKNSGKTSFLNWVLAQNSKYPFGVLTTGRDGEEIDLVYGNPKPAVRLPASTIFSSTSGAIDKLGSAVDVLQKLPFQAGTKKLWLLKALRDLETEIVGPANALAQVQTAELMQTLGAEIVLIDGSLDRKSIALNDKVKGIFLVVGSSFGDIDKISFELARLVQLSHIPEYTNNHTSLNEDSVSFCQENRWQDMKINSLLGNEQEVMNILAHEKPDKLYIPGAISDTVLNGIKPALKDIRDIITRHSLQLHLNKTNLEYLVSSHNMYTLKPFRIVAIIVNSWSVKGNHLDSKILRDRIRQQVNSVPVIDICEA